MWVWMETIGRFLRVVGFVRFVQRIHSEKLRIIFYGFDFRVFLIFYSLLMVMGLSFFSNIRDSLSVAGHLLKAVCGSVRSRTLGVLASNETSYFFFFLDLFSLLPL